MHPTASGSDYLTPYHRAVAEHGPSAEALLWPADWQRQRFMVFASTLALTDKHIADLGSGRADFLAWMYDNDVPYQTYVGVEAMAPFHEFAETRVANEQLPDASLLLADFARDEQLFERLVDEHDSDILLFSGSLNTFDEELALATLDRAWAALADKPGAALAFNFLAGGGSWPRPDTDLPRRDSARWVAWALERTPLVTFCQYYLGTHDATIVMLRAALDS